ncbi:hypothetical protein NW767_015694, partial [Fusarium falciforme]
MAPELFRRVDILEEPSEEQIQNLLRLEISDNLDIGQPRSEQHGLFKLNTLRSGPEVSDRHTYALDIFAIHGLGGDAYRTWQHENGFSWLQHLDEEFPGIRVYSYGYDSGVAFSGGTPRLTDYARHLLTLMKLARASESEKKRKIVFVCHSMGGILAKQAILLASSERGLYGILRQSLCAMVFLATPHSRSESQYYHDILCNIADAVLFPTLADKLIEGLRKALLESLSSSSLPLQLLAKEFQLEAYRIQGLQISCFIEKSTMPGASDI